MGISIFDPVEIAPGIQVIERHDSKGLGWNVVSVALPGGGTLIHGPSWLDDRTFERVGALGEPKVLCVPNHYHAASLEKFRAWWPGAVTVCSDAARGRLERRGHRGLQSVEAVSALLPAGAKWHHTEGTKTGEVWLSIPDDGGTTLMVCDAFFNFTRPVTGLQGLGLKWLNVLPGLKVSTTYQWLAVSNVERCKRWTIDCVRLIAPARVVFSHGRVLEGPDVGSQLVGAIERRWPR